MGQACPIGNRSGLGRSRKHKNIDSIQEDYGIKFHILLECSPMLYLHKETTTGSIILSMNIWLATCPSMEAETNGSPHHNTPCRTDVAMQNTDLAQYHGISSYVCVHRDAAKRSGIRTKRGCHIIRLSMLATRL